MATRLTKKERAFVKEIVKGKNGTNAALAVYDTTSVLTAASLASVNLAKPKIAQAIKEALPDEMLDQIHREGLYATRSVFNDDGEVVAEDADFNVRAKYLDMAYKRKGTYAPEKHNNLNVNVDISDEALDEAAHAYGASLLKRKIG